MIAKCLVIGFVLTLIAQTIYKYQDSIPQLYWDLTMALCCVYWLSQLEYTL